jgi:hypothetical protein
MKKILAVVLMLGLAAAHAEDKKPEAKKAEKSKPAAKSEKNAAQKAEHGIYKWARENKIWTQSK